MNTETKINETRIFLIYKNDYNDFEIKKSDFLYNYINYPIFYVYPDYPDIRVGIIYNISLDVVTYNNLKCLSVYIKYNCCSRVFLIANCDTELLIEILKAKTKNGKNISDLVAELFF